MLSKVEEAVLSATSYQPLIGSGFTEVPNWKSVFWHGQLRLLLVVYVDDFKMAGPTENMSKGWDLIGKHLKIINSSE